MIKRIILTIITVLWMSIIFMFSNQKATLSTENSQSFVRDTIGNIYRFFDRDANSQKVDDIVNMLDVPVRKFAHFTEYFILGVLVYFTLRSFNIKNYYWMILLCFLYAYSDEIHQLFVLGRSCSIFDVLLDTLGSLFSILFFHKKIE